MKKNLSKLEQIRVILGLQAKFEDATLVDGVTKVTADAFTEGATLFVVDAAGNKTPAPEGTHETADLKITVDANGVITSVVAKSKEEVVPAPVPVAAEEEYPEEGENPVLEQVKELVKESIAEEMKKVYMALEEVAKEVKVVKEEMGGMKGKFSKISKEPAAEPVKKSFVKETFEDTEAKIAQLAKFKAQFNKK